MTIRAERSLPTDASHREFTILVNGEEVPREQPLVSLRVSNLANRVASARLVYADGVASSGDFPLSNQSLFAPGAEVQIRAGGSNRADLLFHGVIVRQALKVRAGTSPQLHVECRHAAFRMTLQRRNRNHFDCRDSEVIEDLVGAAQLPCDVEATTVQHAQLVQCDASDWDFVVVRAAANGQAVVTRDDRLVVMAPSASADPVVALQYGATLIELDAELDARLQVESVATVRWDAADQSVALEDAQAPGFAGPGNLAPGDLADAIESGPLTLHHQLTGAEEARMLAQAHWRARQVDKVRGRLYCDGLGQVRPGDVVDVQGIGERFSGQVWISGVLHEMDLARGWKTHLQFGSVALDESLAQRLSRPRATAMVATVPGLQVGIVTDIEDPQGEERVRIRLPLVDAGDDGVWARLASPDAGPQRGWVFRPEPGDEVVVGFFDDDPRLPVVLGMLHSSARPAPHAADADNPRKGLLTRSGLRLLFDDEGKSVTLATPEGRELRLGDDDAAMTLSDGNGNRLVLDDSGITLESRGAIRIRAGGDASLESDASLRIKAGGELSAESSSTAKVQASAALTLKGSTVLIN